MQKADKKGMKKNKEINQESVVFYSNLLKPSLSVPIYKRDNDSGAFLKDFEGKRVRLTELNINGEVKYESGQPCYKDRQIEFSLYSDDFKKGILSAYSAKKYEETEDGAVICDENGVPYFTPEYEALIKAVDDPYSSVMTKEAYEESQNPTAYNSQKRVLKMQGQLIDSNKKIRELEEKLKEAEKSIQKV